MVKRLVYMAVATLIGLIVAYSAYHLPETTFAKKGDGVGVSTNIDELRRLVSIEAGLEVTKWEVFGTPDWDGGVPAPTDYVSVIFVGPASRSSQLYARDESSSVDFLPPNAIRDWLGDEEKVVLRRILDRKSPPANTTCVLKSYQMTNGRTSVDGFTCAVGERNLYFVLIRGPAS